MSAAGAKKFTIQEKECTVMHAIRCDGSIYDELTFAQLFLELKWPTFDI